LGGETLYGANILQHIGNIDIFHRTTNLLAKASFVAVVDSLTRSLGKIQNPKCPSTLGCRARDESSLEQGRVDGYRLVATISGHNTAYDGSFDRSQLDLDDGMGRILSDTDFSS
jgi:hypothetical protein